MNDTASEQINSSTKLKPLVAVVILNWNGKQFLEQFLPSVLASTYTNVKIIVADNASTDDSVSFMANHFPTVQVIQNKENGGFAKGYNMALQHVEADYFVLLNSDVEVTPNWIEPVIELMEQNKMIAACQPKILDFNKKTHFEYAGAAGGFIDYLGYPFARGRVIDTIEEDTGQYDAPTACFWATGACMFVRASVYKELGGLDEYFFAHQEEIDLCWRMQLSGYKIFAQPKSVVYHVGGGTLPKGNSKKVYLNFRNNLIMLYKNSSAGQLLLKLPLRFGLDALAAYKALFGGDAGYFVAVIKAHFGFTKWLFFDKKKSLFPKKIHANLEGYHTKSIIWAYFIKKKQKFSEIF
jgi:GT2 family glycosyltransferase